MRRRTLVPALLGVAFSPLAWSQNRQEDARPPGHFVSALALQDALAQRFPIRYPVAGLLDLDLKTPRLQLLPETNRVGAELEVQAAGPALNRRHSGSLALDFALRFEAADRSLRAHQLRLGRLDFPSLQPGVVEMLNTYGPALGAQALNEVVLHRFSAQDLALPERLGLQPGAITVTADGLVVALVARPL
jgi:hypothetical protein